MTYHLRKAARHIRFLAFAIGIGLLAGCQLSQIDRAGVPASLEATYGIEPRSASAPEFGANGEVRFALHQSPCTNVVDNTGPSDCSLGVVRSALTTGEIWRSGEQYLFTFEFRMDPADLEPNHTATLARWQAWDKPSTPLFELRADATSGASILGRQCVSVDELNEWTRVWVRLLWSSDSTGYLEVRCGGAVQIHQSPVIFAASGIQTGCPRSRPCPDPAQRYNLQLGLIGNAALARKGAAVEMRRIAERRLYVVFGRVTDL